MQMTAKHARLRKALADTNMELSAASRVIDDVPTRSELLQYESRFVELYQQTKRKLDETKKYYDWYNTQDTTLTYLQKEVKLLNSISETFADAMSTNEGKAEFLEQLASIVKGVEVGFWSVCDVLGSILSPICPCSTSSVWWTICVYVAT